MRQARSAGQLPVRGNANARPITGQHQVSQSHRFPPGMCKEKLLTSNNCIRTLFKSRGLFEIRAGCCFHYDILYLPY